MKNSNFEVDSFEKFRFQVPLILMIILMATSGKSVVPKAIELFNTYFAAVLIYLTANATRLGLNPTDVTDLAAHMNDVGTGWKDLHTKHSTAALKSTPGNHDLTDKERAVTQLLHSMYKPIDCRIMTNTDFETLGIAKPVDHNTDRAKITNVPFAIMYCLRAALVHFIVRISDAHGHASIDPLADEIEVRGIFLATADPLPTDPFACPIVFTSTSALIDHQFLPADAGKKFFCFIRYKNSTDDTKSGNWAALVPIYITF
jgi:hypothetical protein